MGQIKNIKLHIVTDIKCNHKYNKTVLWTNQSSQRLQKSWDAQAVKVGVRKFVSSSWMTPTDPSSGMSKGQRGKEMCSLSWNRKEKQEGYGDRAEDRDSKY